MPNTKPSYTDLTHQVVRDASEPLWFVEILRRVYALVRITTKHPDPCCGSTRPQRLSP